MHLKSMVLDGFKSYGKRIEINGFDKEFNAITGLNGSGKSNILDAICFVLGITNLGQVRAGSLQDLVYKSGQAGITKATVTITFDNRDRSSSPMGYEDYEEITVSRQVVIGGKNKYMINGSNVQNKRVQDMFCSVQLNVNNPHFLIMQGRITKVLNMKPPEILSMIEEAAGTRMYETKKQAAFKTIEKKDAKLKEIDIIIREEIGPKLNKLQEEKSQYLELQRIERELEHCRRIHVAWRYVSALQNREKAEEDVQKVKDQITEKEKNISDGKNEVVDIEKRLVEMYSKRDSEKGGKLEAIEHELKDAEKKQHKVTAEANSNKESIKAEESFLAQLKTNVSDDENALALKQKELESVGGLFNALRESDQKDTAAFEAAQQRFQKISSGLLQSDDGENATLEQQLINAKQSAIQAQTEVKQCEMTLAHSKEQLRIKQKDMQSTNDQYNKDSKNLENMEKELKNLENELTKLNYEDGALEGFQEEKRKLSKEIRTMQERVDNVESAYPQLRFQYQDPEPNFRRESVHGIVAKLITVKDRKAAYALDVAAGGRLYNLIVDTEKTSKNLLQRGQLQQRITIIPLNKISGRTLDPHTISLAQKLVGEENVQPALSLIDFPDELTPAMNWVFGQTFICKDMDAAKKVTFNERIKKKSVTLDGDVFDPSGTLSGGAVSKSGSVLLKLEEIKVIQDVLNKKEQDLMQINAKFDQISKAAEKYASLKQRFDLRSHEVEMVRKRLQQTSHHKIKEEVDALQATIEEMLQKIDAAKKLEKDSTKRAKEIEEQVKDAANIRERQLKEAEMAMKTLKARSMESRKHWQQREQESETLNLEIKELQKTIETGKAQIVTVEEKLATLKEKAESFERELNEVTSNVKILQTSLKTQKDAINQQNKDIQKVLARKEEIIKQRGEDELDIKKLGHEIVSIQNKAADCKNRIAELSRKYEWIEQDKAYFGEAGGMYNFEVNKPEEMGQKLHKLESLRENLSRNVNTRAMNLLGKEVEQYNDLKKKKKIVENDKKKIIETIHQLDEKKKEILLKAWEQVNKDFGSIFSSLLPGANAKLQPPENQSVLDGLEVKIGFSGVWKESLGELSGGQRSLVALSLILAMLLFKPAPLYILDEVDAALDLSHTQNIGTMLKQHFKHSQFIIVSLKDGMFNNANVLFRTKFVDGMSTISRTVNRKH